MKGTYKIPFDKNGNQLDYPSQWGNSVWQDNHVFSDKLELVCYGRGRSSVTFTMRRNNGSTVSVFVSDFTDMVQHMVRGHVTGNFTFVKKGQNYGCRMVGA